MNAAKKRVGNCGWDLGEAVNLSQQVSTNHLVGLGLIYTH